jgi:hypothetical protein
VQEPHEIIAEGREKVQVPHTVEGDGIIAEKDIIKNRKYENMKLKDEGRNEEGRGNEEKKTKKACNSK